MSVTKARHLGEYLWMFVELLRIKRSIIVPLYLSDDHEINLVLHKKVFGELLEVKTDRVRKRYDLE